MSLAASWSVVLRHYGLNGRRRVRAEIEWFRSQPSVPDAVRHAALALDHRGKRYSHQSRLSRESLEEGDRRLSDRQSAHGEINDFDTLLCLVQDAVADVPGLGELYAYDTAVQIGAKLGILPDKVYLHAGTRLGAARLGFKVRGAFLDTKVLPEELRALPAYEVEDILCIYKDQLPRA